MVIPLVALHNIVQELFEVALADACGALDRLFDLRQVDAVGAKGPYVLHRDLVELTGQLQAGAYLVKEGCLQAAVKSGYFFREGVQ